MNELAHAVEHLASSIEGLTRLLEREGLTQGIKKEEKEKKRTKRKEKQERSDDVVSETENLQKVTTDQANITNTNPLSEILPIAERRKVGSVILERWIKTYEVRFIVDQINLAENWLHTKKGPPKRDYGRFFNNWLTRAYNSNGNPFNKQSEQSDGQSDASLDQYFGE